MIWLAVGCAEPPASDTGAPIAAPTDPDALSSLGLMEWTGDGFEYAEGVWPYRLATPLFSDFAVKLRAIRLPPGESATYDPAQVLDFPVGTVIVKSFLFPADLRAPEVDLRVVETRVLTLLEDGWDTWPYLWNEAQTDATRAPSGDVVPMSFVGLDGEPVTFSYLVPQRNQCIDCHALQIDGEDEEVPIGTKARHLHVDGQLEELAALGGLAGLPNATEIPAAVDARLLEGVDWALLSDAEVERAARDYLDINCAHCHNPDGEEGRSSQLFLNWDNADPFTFGVCKRPGSAGAGGGGLTFDIVPGEPEQSILWYRLQTTTVGEMMPDIGRALADTEGVDLVAEWIRRLEGSCSE